ncbi:hypothetical protein BDV06DRAFT_138425 [Aspergillus oleicola]
MPPAPIRWCLHPVTARRDHRGLAVLDVQCAVPSSIANSRLSKISQSAFRLYGTSMTVLVASGTPTGFLPCCWLAFQLPQMSVPAVAQGRALHLGLIMRSRLQSLVPALTCRSFRRCVIGHGIARSDSCFGYYNSVNIADAGLVFGAPEMILAGSVELEPTGIVNPVSVCVSVSRPISSDLALPLLCAGSSLIGSQSESTWSLATIALMEWSWLPLCRLP